MATIINSSKVALAMEIVKAKDASSKLAVFRYLAAANLLNAAIKQKEYKECLHYGFIKNNLSRMVESLLFTPGQKFLEQLYISKRENCLYIRVCTLQFSFHNVLLLKKMRRFAANPPEHVGWDGIRLQPLAEQILDLAEKRMTEEFDLESALFEMCKKALQK